MAGEVVVEISADGEVADFVGGFYYISDVVGDFVDGLVGFFDEFFRGEASRKETVERTPERFAD